MSRIIIGDSTCIRCGTHATTYSHVVNGFCEDCLLKLKESGSGSSERAVCVHLATGINQTTHSEAFYFSHQVRFANARVGICKKHLEEGLAWFEQQRVAERARHATIEKEKQLLIAAANKKKHGNQLSLW